MSDLSEDLDAISKRAETSEFKNFLDRAVMESRIIKADVPFLLALVRDQAAKLARVEGLVDRFKDEAENAEIGERHAAEANNGPHLMALQSNRYAYEQAERWLRAAVGDKA